MSSQLPGNEQRMLAPGQIIDQYQIVRLVGTGDFARVYEAIHQASGETVAIKRVSFEDLDDEMLPHIEAVYLNEVRMLDAVDALGVPQLFDHFYMEGDDAGYIVTTFVHGQTLNQYRQLVAKDRHLTPSQVINIAEQVCETMLYLVSKGIVFGDLNADNIMLAFDGAIYLIDFGLATYIDEDQPLIKAFGSIGFVPPEHLQSALWSEAIDVYALGATMHELLSGELAKLQPEYQFPPLALGRNLHDLEQLIFAMVEQDSELRPAFAQVLRELVRIRTESHGALLHADANYIPPARNFDKNVVTRLNVGRRSIAPSSEQAIDGIVYGLDNLGRPYVRPAGSGLHDISFVELWQHEERVDYIYPGENSTWTVRRFVDSQLSQTNQYRLFAEESEGTLVYRVRVLRRVAK